VLSFRDAAILNAYSKEEGLKARLREELKAVDLLTSCFEGHCDLRTCVSQRFFSPPCSCSACLLTAVWLLLQASGGFAVGGEAGGLREALAEQGRGQDAGRDDEPA
jgi:hypothetical protein